MARAMTDMASAMGAQGFYGSSVPTTPGTAPTGFARWCERTLKPAVLA